MMGALGRAWHTPRSFVVDSLPAGLYLALLFWAGLIPLKSLPGPDFALADKVWHMMAFGALAALLSRVLRHFRCPLEQAIAVAALVSAALGALLELLQSLTPYRSADFADLAADALGAVLAYVVLRWLAKVGGLLGAPAPV
jgi:VanZ family protein